MPDDAVGKIVQPPAFGGCGSRCGGGLAVCFDHLKDRIGFEGRGLGAGGHGGGREGSNAYDAGGGRN